jgi:hypothetical protein
MPSRGREYLGQSLTCRKSVTTTIMQVSVGKEIRLIAQFNEQLDREPGTLLTRSVAPESIYLFDPATDESVR